MGAIFPTTALKAWDSLNNGDASGIPTDLIELQRKLYQDNNFNIEMTTVVLRYYAKELYKSGIQTDLSMEQWKNVVGRYNALGADKQKKYSDKVFEYLAPVRVLLQ